MAWLRGFLIDLPTTSILAINNQSSHDQCRLLHPESGSRSRHEPDSHSFGQHLQDGVCPERNGAKKKGSLSSFFPRRVEDVSILSSRGSCLDVKRIQTVPTFCQEVYPDRIESQPAVDERSKVGALLQMTRKRANRKADMCCDHSEHGPVEEEDRVVYQPPEPV